MPVGIEPTCNSRAFYLKGICYLYYNFWLQTVEHTVLTTLSYMPRA